MSLSKLYLNIYLYITTTYSSYNSFGKVKSQQYTNKLKASSQTIYLFFFFSDYLSFKKLNLGLSALHMRRWLSANQEVGLYQTLSLFFTLILDFLSLNLSSQLCFYWKRLLYPNSHLTANQRA